MQNKIEEFKKIIKEGQRIVFFTGAGVSTDSGIPDFRSQDGLYNQTYDYPPERIISRSFFDENPEEFYRFYKDKMLVLDAKPNFVHTFIAELEKHGKSLGVVTQNIDGLHSKAGSTHVDELHGSILRNYCMDCHTLYDAEYIENSTDIPRCEKCGGIIKPDVVLYEEGLDQKVMINAIRKIAQADVLVVMGTSLVVYPAAGLLDFFQGDKLVLINKSITDRDNSADLTINATFKEVFENIDINELI